MAVVRTTGRAGFGTDESDEIYGYTPTRGEGNLNDYLFGFTAESLELYNLDAGGIYFLSAAELIGRYQETVGSIDDGADLLAGGEGDDFLFGGGGDDFLTGGPDSFPNLDGFSGFSTGNDVLFGGWGNDRLAGGNAVNTPARDGSPGRDILIGGPGDDLLFGSRGDDTAWYRGALNDYSFEYLEDGTVKVRANADSAFANEGVDTLTDMEFARFSDVTIPLFAPARLTVAADPAPLAGREGDDATTIRTYIVSRDGALDRPLTVNWTMVLGGSQVGASRGAGVEDVSGPREGLVTFAPGSASAVITIGVEGDVKPEYDEYYEIKLTQRNASNPIAAPVSVTDTIFNDDWPTVSIKPVGGADLIVFEGATPAMLRVEISAAADFDIEITADFNPNELETQAALSTLKIPAGTSSIDLPFARGLTDQLIERIQTGTVVFNAIGGIDRATGAPKTLELTEPAIPVQIKDEALSPEATADLAAGLTWGKRLATYVANTTDLAYALELEKVPVSTAARTYVDTLNQTATLLEVAFDGALVLRRLNDDLATARRVATEGATPDPAGGAIIAYDAYRDANVNFTVNLVGTAVSTATSAFAVGVATAFAATAAAPVLTGIVVGIGVGIAYDKFIADTLRTPLLGQYEAENSRQKFYDAYTSIILNVIDGYIEGATVFIDADDDGRLDDDEMRGITNAQGRAAVPLGLGDVIAFGGRDVLSGLDLAMELSSPQGATIVSPLTTVLRALIDAGVQNAQAKLLSGLGLANDIDLLAYNAVEAVADGDAAGRATFLRGAQVYATVVGLSQMLNGDGPEMAATARAVVSELASKIASGSVDLDTLELLRSIFDATADALNTSPTVEPTAGLRAIADANAALWALLESAPGAALLENAGAIQADLLADPDPEPTGPVAGPSQRLVVGTVADETHRGSGEQDLFFFDLARESAGGDTVRGFGTNDLFVSTRQLFDSNNDGVIAFGGNKLLDFDPERGVTAFFDEAGRRVTRLEFDGPTIEGGVEYFVYSRLGSPAGLDDLSFG